MICSFSVVGLFVCLFMESAVADHLALDRLKSMCEDVLQQAINLENCIDLLKVAYRYSGTYTLLFGLFFVC
jgi:hypothetical protein